MVRAISVYSAGVPYIARFTVAVKTPLPWLRFSFRIRFDRKLSESYFVGLWIKQIVLNKCLESAEERARARASSACAQTVYDKGGTVEVYGECFKLIGLFCLLLLHVSIIF